MCEFVCACDFAFLLVCVYLCYLLEGEWVCGVVSQCLFSCEAMSTFVNLTDSLDPIRHFSVNKVDIIAKVDRLDKVEMVERVFFVDMVYKVDMDPFEPN